MVRPEQIIELSEGKGRGFIELTCHYIGKDLVVHIYNEQAHLGAVAVSEYDHKEKRASTSVITRLGHKDDTVAQSAAHDICKNTRRSVCVIAGIHLDNVTESEIKQLVANSSSVIIKLINKIKEGD